MLDGQTSLDELKERFEDEFPPQKITLEELQQFLGMLHRSGLVVVAAAGAGTSSCCKRRSERWRKEWINALSNVLCIRFKGFDPERFLNWLYPYVRWFFAPLVVAMCLLLILSAATLVTVQLRRLPRQAAGLPHVLQLLQRLLALRGAVRDQGDARVRPRPAAANTSAASATRWA